MDSELEEMTGDGDFQVPGLGVIVYREGAQVYSKFLGRRVIGKRNFKPVTSDTRFRAASISKMFTVFTILQLVEQGKINLDEDVSEYLNFELRNPNFRQKKITVRNLASHTSSLRDGTIYSIPPNFSLAEFFKSDGKFFESGAHFGTEENFFTYSNLNYGILGTVIENVTGVRFDIYQKKNILAQLETRADYLPSNLLRADFEKLGAIYQKNQRGDWYAKIDDFKNIQPPQDTISLQNPYKENFRQSYSLKDYKIGTNGTIFSPQGGLRISFEEMANTLEMLMNGGIFHGKQILSQKSFAEMFKPQWIYNGKNGSTCGGVFQSYGLGVYFIDGKSSNRLCKNHEINFVGHSGEAFGMLSGIFFIPKTKTGLIYMINGTPFDVEKDSRSQGIFSDNYIWEEKIIDAVCNFL
ncbi:MAG: beta-lactamase family protein [Selenomonadaceae bacterium]|nr:beta-lactamase family protein [Selenomonadaceae bacterium]